MIIMVEIGSSLVWCVYVQIVLSLLMFEVKMRTISPFVMVEIGLGTEPSFCDRLCMGTISLVRF